MKCLFGTLALGVLLSTQAFADLKVYPTRVLFEGKTRTASVQLKHIGSKKTKYRIRTVFYEVLDNGKYKEKKDPLLEIDHFIGPLVRFSPRQVTLEPGIEQTVRIMVRPKQGLADGEYRGHLHFATYEEQDAVELYSGKKNKDGIAMALKAQRAVAIPIIYRKGSLSSSLTIGDMTPAFKTSPKTPFVAATFLKKGNKSVYGDAALYHYRSGGEKVMISLVKGISFYTEKLTVQLPFNVESKVTIPKSGTLELEFRPEKVKDEKRYLKHNIAL